MINKLIFTRCQRLFNSDFTTPMSCKAKWWYMDINEKCTCKISCKFKDYSKTDWVKYANKSYIKTCLYKSKHKK